MANSMRSVLANLRTLIANVPKWIAWTGSDDATEARTHIYTKFLRDEDGFPDTPYIQLQEVLDSIEREEVATATYLVAGEIDILVVGEIATAKKSDPQAAPDEYRDDYYDLLEGIQEQSGQANDDGTRMFVTVSDHSGPRLIEVAEQSDNSVRYDLWQGTIRARWGHRGGA
jgi:hypothetical protein